MILDKKVRGADMISFFPHVILMNSMKVNKFPEFPELVDVGNMILKVADVFQSL